MATSETKSTNPATRRAPRPKTTHVFAVPIVELAVSPRCAHGCFVVTSTSPTVWHFEGIGDSIEVGPGAQQADVLIHAHEGEDDLDPCDPCWAEED